MRVRVTLFFACVMASLAPIACARTTAPMLPGETSDERAREPKAATPISHVILMIQENRTFNNLFAAFPGAIGTTIGEELVLDGNQYVETPIALAERPLAGGKDLTHLYKAFLMGWHHGAMDGFNLIKAPVSGKLEGSEPYQYVEPITIAQYWAIAEQWGLADEMFQTQGSDSFAAHQDLIRGSTCITPACDKDSYQTQSLIDQPSTESAWGCDSKPRTTTPLITGARVLLHNAGPFPCSNQFPDYASGGYETLRDLLDAKSVSWKYYTPTWKIDTTSTLWNAFDVIAAVRYGSEWKTNVVSPETRIFTDIKNGSLPAMSWVIPKTENSDHPGYSKYDLGPAWIASVVNAVGSSPYWDSTAVIVVWDDWGGFYDPVAPPTPRDNQGGPGFRVPMLVISPYVRVGNGSNGGYISKTKYSFGSILRFVEDTFDLGRLGTSDTSWPSIGDMFDFKQQPRKFVKIVSQHPSSFFIHQRPSTLPVDTE
jgi:phospholipase C